MHDPVIFILDLDIYVSEVSISFVACRRVIDQVIVFRGIDHSLEGGGSIGRAVRQPAGRSGHLPAGAENILGLFPPGTGEGCMPSMLIIGALVM